MQQILSEQNRAHLRGAVYRAPRFSHSYRGRNYYSMLLSVPRLSGTLDILPVTLSEPLAQQPCLQEPGSWVEIMGQLRSFNRRIGEHHALLISLYARSVSPCSTDQPSFNEICLEGFVCRKPQYRTTPMRRRICDLMIAVNRSTRGSDYLPVISWGEQAEMAAAYGVGSFVRVVGRFQSREYEKRDEQGQTEIRVAYEISATEVKMGEF